MEALEVLAHIRPLVVVIDRQGTILDAFGSADGIVGYQPSELVGHHTLEFVAPADRPAVADIFAAGGVFPNPNTPSSFPVTLVGVDGATEIADAIPRGYGTDGHGTDDGGWVVTIVPRRTLPPTVNMLDLLIDDAPLAEIVRAMLRWISTERGTASSASALLRPLTADAEVITPRRDRIAGALRILNDSGNDRLWRDVPGGETVELLVEQLPAVLRVAAELDGLQSCQVTNVTVDGVAACVLVVCSTDRVAAGLRGNAAINRREQVRILSHAIRRDDADRALRAAALKDALTGLSNRGMFDQVLDELDAHDATLLFIDLDHFKAINDEFGHDVGDQVLVEVAARLRAGCRPEDVVARIGGDEFVVLLVNTDEFTAFNVSQRLLDAIADPLPSGLGPASVSASVGFVRRVGHTDPQELLQAADRAMLHGKRTGRARLVIGS